MIERFWYLGFLGTQPVIGSRRTTWRWRRKRLTIRKESRYEPIKANKWDDRKMGKLWGSSVGFGGCRENSGCRCREVGGVVGQLSLNMQCLSANWEAKLLSHQNQKNLKDKDWKTKTEINGQHQPDTHVSALFWTNLAFTFRNKKRPFCWTCSTHLDQQRERGECIYETRTQEIVL